MYHLDKESSEAFCLCCLTGRLCFLSVADVNAAYNVWNLFCIRLKPSKTEKYPVIIHLFTDLQFHISQPYEPTYL